MGSFSKKLSVFLRIKITLQSKTMSFDERREYVSKLRIFVCFALLSVCQNLPLEKPLYE
jgi:hypothetical protein